MNHTSEGKMGNSIQVPEEQPCPSCFQSKTVLQDVCPAFSSTTISHQLKLMSQLQEYDGQAVNIKERISLSRTSHSEVGAESVKL